MEKTKKDIVILQEELKHIQINYNNVSKEAQELRDIEIKLNEKIVDQFKQIYQLNEQFLIEKNQREQNVSMVSRLDNRKIEQIEKELQTKLEKLSNTEIEQETLII